MENGAYGNDLINLQTYLQNDGMYDRAFFSLPEDIQAQVNERARPRGFASAQEMRAYIQTLLLKA